LTQRIIAALSAVLFTATFSILPVIAYSDRSVIQQALQSSDTQAIQQELIASGLYPVDLAGGLTSSNQSASANLQSIVAYASNGVPFVSLSNDLPFLETASFADEGSSLSRGNNSLNDIMTTDETAKSADAAKTSNDNKTSNAAKNSDAESSSVETAASERVTTTEATAKPAISFGSEIQRLAWFGDVNSIYAKGDVATVTDLATGLKMQIMRTGGTNHADCETINGEQTAILLQVADGEWNWTRRPVIVEIDGYTIAASLTARPHAGRDDQPAHETVSNRSGGYGRGINWDSVKGNNMDGHFDIHFYGSRTHSTNHQDSAHQAAIKVAYFWGKG